MHGLTRDVPYSPLEANVEVRGSATLPNDREAHLSIWALPRETEEVAAARAVLRKVAVRWWKWNLEREVRSWLADRARRGTAKEELVRNGEGVEDCILRARACTYWSWVRGSRLFFWRFPSEYLADARDGVPFWREKEPPPGRVVFGKGRKVKACELPSYQAESREASWGHGGRFSRCASSGIWNRGKESPG